MRADDPAGTGAGIADPRGAVSGQAGAEPAAAARPPDPAGLCVLNDWRAELPPGAADRGLLVDAQGWPDAALAALLDRLDGAALGERLVVAFGPDQLDRVAAALLGSGAQLLCEPTAAERAGAAVLARARGRASVGDPEGVEAARLAAIAEEVARIAEALGGIARRTPAGAPAIADRRIGFDAADAAPATLAAQVRGAIRSRRLRDAEFGAGWFEEPAWDMLLDLFAAELEGARVSVSSLCIAAAVAQTTALRWITKMLGAGLLEREADASDRRRAFLSLSPRASAGMRRYVDTVARAGLGIA